MPSPILFLTACLIWGSTFYAITLQLGDIAPAVSVVYRFGLASAALFTWCRLRGDTLRMPWKTQRWMMLQGCATFGISYICTYTAEQYIVSGLVAVLFALMVFWNPICHRIAFGTPLSWRMLRAAGVTMCGVTLLFSHSIRAAWNEVQAGGNGHFLLGLVLATVASIGGSVGNIVVVKVREQSSNVLLTMAWSMLWGTVMVAGWALISGATFRMPSTPGYWAGLIYLALFGSVIAFSAYFTLITRIGSNKAVYIGVVTPVISVLLSIKLENYHPGLLEWAGMVMCLASVAWVLKPAAPPKPVHIEESYRKAS